MLPKPRGAVHPDAAAVVLDDLLADRQAETRSLRFAGPRVAHLDEPLEDLLLVLGGNSRPGVADRDLDGLVEAAGINLEDGKDAPDLLCAQIGAAKTAAARAGV